MKASSRKAFEAFLKNKEYRDRVVSTDGRVFFSYETVIAVPKAPGQWMVTDKKWSHTTTIVCNDIVSLLASSGTTTLRVSQDEVEARYRELPRK